jgi:hypothetical protein
MTDLPTNERRPTLHLFQTAHRNATWWLGAIVGSLALLLAAPAIGHAEETNPNNYNCFGGLAAGTPEPGSEEQQVQYTFHCNGPITGYQLQAQIPLTGVQSPPLLTSIPAATPLNDTFSCSGEVPGYAFNCVGAAKAGYEQITGQFAIGAKLCVEPRVDPLLTVTYASVEKGAIVQAISGPFDLGRPNGCKADAYSGSTRLAPKALIKAHKKKAAKNKGHKKATVKKH